MECKIHMKPLTSTRREFTTLFSQPRVLARLAGSTLRCQHRAVWRRVSVSEKRFYASQTTELGVHAKEKRAINRNDITA